MINGASIILRMIMIRMSAKKYSCASLTPNISSCAILMISNILSYIEQYPFFYIFAQTLLFIHKGINIFITKMSYVATTLSWKRFNRQSICMMKWTKGVLECIVHLFLL